MVGGIFPGGTGERGMNKFLAGGGDSPPHPLVGKTLQRVIVSAKKVFRLFRMHYIFSRNHFNMILLINMQKTKKCPK